LQPGWYVTVHVKNVPEKVVLAQEPGQPIIIFGMLPHETKMTVMNVVMKRCRFGSQEPIKSKETLIIHLGYRRFVVNPIFSQHTNGSKHKVISVMQNMLMFTKRLIISVRKIFPTRGDHSCHFLCTNHVSTCNLLSFQAQN
jgi:40S ribosome biogenesis protein Tsr1 and BMS1 C-terminal